MSGWVNWVAQGGRVRRAGAGREIISCFVMIAPRFLPWRPSAGLVFSQHDQVVTEHAQAHRRRKTRKSSKETTNQPKGAFQAGNSPLDPGGAESGSDFNYQLLVPARPSVSFFENAPPSWPAREPLANRTPATLTAAELMPPSYSRSPAASSRSDDRPTSRPPAWSRREPAGINPAARLSGDASPACRQSPAAQSGAFLPFPPPPSALPLASPAFRPFRGPIEDFNLGGKP